MATKADFTADEWKVILSSPALAGMGVTLAEPSGIWGMMKEGMASGSALLEAKGDPGASASRCHGNVRRTKFCPRWVKVRAHWQVVSRG